MDGRVNPKYKKFEKINEASKQFCKIYITLFFGKYIIYMILHEFRNLVFSWENYKMFDLIFGSLKNLVLFVYFQYFLKFLYIFTWFIFLYFFAFLLFSYLPFCFLFLWSVYIFAIILLTTIFVTKIKHF